MYGALIKAFILAILLNASVLTSSISQSWPAPTSHSNFGSQVSIDELLQHSVRAQLNSFHLLRQRREVDVKHLYRDTTGVWLLDGLKNQRGCPRATRQFKVFSTTTGEQYAIIATSAEVNNTEIYSFHKERGCVNLLQVLHTRTVFDFEVLPGKDSLRIVTLEQNPKKIPHLRTGSTVYSVTFRDFNVTVSREEVLRSEQPTCLTSWEQDGLSHLAICDGKSRDAEPKFASICSVYSYSRGFLDQYDEIQAHLPQSVAHFRVFSKHYLAIANRPDETELEDVPTEIFRYDVALKSYRHLQFLPTKGAKDLCFFSLGSGRNTESFLAVINEFTFDKNRKIVRNVASFIYKFIGEKFEPFQSISVNHRATGCAVHQVNGEQVALIISTVAGAEVVQYNGWRFVRTLEYSSHALGEGISRINVAPAGSDYVLTVANSNPLLAEKDNIFLPKFSNSLHSTVTSIHDKNLNDCRQTRLKLKNDPINLITGLYNQAIKKNDTHISLGSVEFRNLTAKKVFTNEVYVKSNSSRLGIRQISQLKDLTKRVKFITSQLETLNHKVKNGIRKSGNYTIYGEVKIRNLEVVSIAAKSLTTNTVNSVNTQTLFEEVARSSDEYLPLLNVTRLTAHHVNTSVLSDKLIAQFVRTDQDISFGGTLQVTGNLIVNSDLQVQGMIDDCIVSPRDVLLQNGNQALEWTLRTHKLHAQNADVKIETLNGENVYSLYKSALTSSANLTLNYPRFRSLSAREIRVKGLINRIDLKELTTNAMKLTGDQLVTGNHEYSDADLGKVTLRDKLNEKNFTKDFVTVNKGDVLRVKHLKLKDNASFAKLKVSKTVGDIAVNANFTNKYLARTFEGVQIVTGTKTFSGIKAASTISSLTLNGFPMDKFDTDETLYGDPNKMLFYDSANVQGKLSFKKTLSVNEIDGLDLERIKLAIPLSEESLTSMQTLTFTGNIEITGNLSPTLLNDVPTSSLILKNSSAPISFRGLKTFAQPLSLTRTFKLTGSLNGYNLTELWEQSLKIEANQTIEAPLHVKGDLNVERLRASNLSPISINYLGEITGKKQFQGLTIEGDWYTDSLELTGTFNDMDVNSWAFDTIMKKSKDQAIKSRKSLKSITVDNLRVTAVDDANIDELLNVVLVDQPAVIHSDVTFQVPVSTTSLKVNGTIDGVESDAPLFWLKQNKKQNIIGPVVVEGLLTVNNYSQDTWLINDFDAEDFTHRALRTDEASNVASLTFDHLIVDNMEVNGLIQKINVSKDLVLKSSLGSIQTINGRKSFVAPLISASLEINKHLNGHEPSIACNSNVPVQNSHWVIYGNVVVKGSNKFSVTSINNRTLLEVLKNAWIKDEDLLVTSPQLFDHAIVNEALQKDVISGISLSDLNRRVMKLEAPSQQIVTALHRYETVEVKNELLANRLFSPDINGVKIEDLQTKVLLKKTEQTIPGTLTLQNALLSDILVDELVSDIDIKSDIARKDRAVDISGTKLLESLFVEKDVEMCPGCLIGSYDLSDWANRAVLRTGNYALPGGHFESMTFQEPVALRGQLNDITVTKDHLLTLSDSQLVTGQLTLSSHMPLNVPYGNNESSLYQRTTEDFTLASRFGNLQVNGLYTGVTLSHFYDKAIRNNVLVTFSKPVVLSSLIAQQIEDSSDVSTLREIVKHDVNGTFHTAPSHRTPFNNTAEIAPISTLVQHIGKVVSHHTFELKFFEETRLVGRIPPGAYAAHAWESTEGIVELSLVTDHGQVFPTLASTTPVLEGVEVTGMATSTEAFGDLAITTVNKVEGFSNSSFIVSLKENGRIQAISTAQPLACVALSLLNQSCFLFLEREENSPVYCRSFLTESYDFAFELPIRGARLMVAGYRQTVEPPILAVSQEPLRGMNRILVWKSVSSTRSYQPWKTINTLEVRFMDSICDETHCLLATVAPSRPASIPGQVVIWSLTDEETPIRLQRIPFAEPMQVKFALLPDGRKLLIVLQSSGVDNVSVFIQRDMQQFRLVTTVRVPGARNLEVVIGRSQVTLVLSIGASGASPFATVRLFRARFLGQFL